VSAKSDRDNRSNQLNPNNNAYHSSRGHGRDDDDEAQSGRQYLGTVDAGERAAEILAREMWERERNRPVETTFRAAFVALTGIVKVIQFSSVTSPGLGGRSANEDFAEILVSEIGRQLGLKWQSDLGLLGLWDDEDTDMFWADYDRNPLRKAIQGKNAEWWNEHGAELIAKVRAFVADPTNGAFRMENWGQVLKHPSLHFTRLSKDFYQQVTELLEENERRSKTESSS
jgi:hypothetical protein